MRAVFIILWLMSTLKPSLKIGIVRTRVSQSRAMVQFSALQARPPQPMPLVCSLKVGRGHMMTSGALITSIELPGLFSGPYLKIPQLMISPTWVRHQRTALQVRLPQPMCPTRLWLGAIAREGYAGRPRLTRHLAAATARRREPVSWALATDAPFGVSARFADTGPAIKGRGVTAAPLGTPRMVSGYAESAAPIVLLCSYSRSKAMSCHRPSVRGGKCSFTGRVHLHLHGLCDGVFLTSKAEPYPHALDALWMRNQTPHCI